MNGGYGSQPARTPLAELPTPPGSVLPARSNSSWERGIVRANQASKPAEEVGPGSEIASGFAPSSLLPMIQSILRIHSPPGGAVSPSHASEVELERTSGHMPGKLGR